MSLEGLKFISDFMDRLNIPYEFGTFTQNPVPDPYFVGEYLDSESDTKEENGYQESAFLLTGTGETYIGLETAKAQIESNLSRGVSLILSNGNGFAVFYSGSQPIPTDDERLKRIQINLTIKEWSVN